jgi:N-acetylglucosaminyl-diphospho-decaprenol L-rhamnosyltransferase
MCKAAYLTIVVVTHNSQRHLPDLVASLSGGLRGIARWRLVVVDNASSDDTVRTFRELLPEAELIALDANRGYAAGINAGLHEIPSDCAVLILNPDVRLHDGSVAALLDAIDADAVGIAVPRLVSGGRTSHSLRREPSIARMWGEAVLGGRMAGRLGLSEVITSSAQYVRDHDADWATGAVMAISAGYGDLSWLPRGGRGVGRVLLSLL